MFIPRACSDTTDTYKPIEKSSLAQRSAYECSKGHLPLREQFTRRLSTYAQYACPMTDLNNVGHMYTWESERS